MKDKKQMQELSDADLDLVTGGTSAAAYAVSALERVAPTSMVKWAVPADLDRVASPALTLQAGVAHHDVTEETGQLSHDAFVHAASIPFIPRK